MPRVVALNNHPYGSGMKIKGQEYDCADEDLDLIVNVLKRARIAAARPTYQTRDMQAQPAPQVPSTEQAVITTGGNPITLTEHVARRGRPRKQP